MCDITKQKSVPFTIASNLKYKSLTLNTTLTNTPAMNPLASYDGSATNYGIISRGTDRNERIGNKIRIKRIHGRYQIIAGDYYNQVRVLIVQSKRGNLGSTASNYMEQLAGSSGQNSNPPFWDNVEVLYDELLHAYEAIGANTTTRHAIRDISCRPPGHILTYSQGTDLADYPVYLVLMSDSPGTPNPGIYGYITVEFEDVQ